MKCYEMKNINIQKIVILSLILGMLGACSGLQTDVKPNEISKEQHNYALADLDKKIYITKKEFNQLPSWMKMEHPAEWELIKTNLEIAEIHSGKNDYIKTRNYYSEALAIMLNLKKSKPSRDDMDGDGIPDDKDKCPEKQEDINGFMDEDGCPENAKYFVVITSDENSKLILPEIEITPNTYMVIHKDKPYSGIIGVISPGKYTMKLKHDGMEDYEKPLSVPTNEKRITIKAVMSYKK